MLAAMKFFFMMKEDFSTVNGVLNVLLYQGVVRLVSQNIAVMKEYNVKRHY